MGLLDYVKAKENQYISFENIIRFIAEQTGENENNVIIYLNSFLDDIAFDCYEYHEYGVFLEYSDMVFEQLLDMELGKILDFSLQINSKDGISGTYVLKDWFFNLDCIKKLKLDYSNIDKFNIDKTFTLATKQDIDNTYNKITNKKLQAENDRLKTENMALQAKIADLESQLTDNKPLGAGVSDNELLAKIFDDTKPYIYAPELHNAIRVWQYIYHDCLTSPHLANHSDKFDKAVKSLNIEFNSNALKDRLKQVTTPQQQKEKTKSKNS